MRKEVDNFNLIADRFFNESNGVLDEDTFFFVQILVRGKDGHHVSGNNKNRLVKYYTITSAIHYHPTIKAKNENVFPFIGKIKVQLKP